MSRLMPYTFTMLVALGAIASTAVAATYQGQTDVYVYVMQGGQYEDLTDPTSSASVIAIESTDDLGNLSETRDTDSMGRAYKKFSVSVQKEVGIPPVWLNLDDVWIKFADNRIVPTWSLHENAFDGPLVDTWQSTDSTGPILREDSKDYFLIAMFDEISPHPVTDWDMPLANMPGGTAPSWGPRGSTGGVMRLYSGDFTEHAVDLSVPGRGLDAVFGRRYLSADCVGSEFGNSWGFSLGISAHQFDAYFGVPASISMNLGNGRIVKFEDKYNALGAISGGPGLDNRRPYIAEGWPCILGAQVGESFLRWEDGSIWIIDDLFVNNTVDPGSLVRPKEIRDPNGNTIHLSYNSSNNIDTVTDTLDRVYQFAYYAAGDDNEGKLHTITEQGGLSRVVEYEYYTSTPPDSDDDGNPDGNIGDLARVTYLSDAGANERTVSYIYAVDGGTDAIGGGTVPAGMLLEIIDAKGLTVVRNHYNSDGQVKKQTFEDANAVTTYTYAELDPAETVDIGPATSTEVSVVRETCVKDPEGIVTQYQFDEDNRLIRRRRYTGHATTADAYVGDADLSGLAANKLRAGDPNYYETTYAWNDHDNLAETKDSGGCQTTFAYAPDTEQNPAPLARGHVTVTNRYDTNGANAIQSTNTYLTTTNGLHRVHQATLTESDASTITTTYGYDAKANVTSVTHPDSSVETFDYTGGSGWVTSYTSPPTVTAHDGTHGNARTDTFAYTFNDDKSYKVVTKRDDGGENIESTENYDVVGRLASSVDPKGNSSNYEYTLYDLLERAIAPAPGNGSSARPATAYEYDENGNTTIVTVSQFDENGGAKPPIVTKYEYDTMERVEKVVRDANGLGATTKYEYDKNGRVTKRLTPEAVAGLQPDNYVQYAYDERGLVFTTTRAGEETTQLDYNAWGSLATQTFPDTTTATYACDEYGRGETSTARDGTFSKVLERNNRGLVKDARIYENSTLAETLSKVLTTYDAMGRSSNVKVDADAVGTTYHYAPSGQLWKTVDPELDAVTAIFDSMQRPAEAEDGQNNTVSNTYDENSNVSQLDQTDHNEKTSTSEALPPVTTQYDNLNRPISHTDVAGNTTLAKYDSLGRVRWTQDAEDHTTTYTYDNLGRKRGMAFYEAGEVDPIATTSQDYDLNGRLISRTDSKGHTTSYEYDKLDRCYKIEYADGSSMEVLSWYPMNRPHEVRNPDGTTVTYAYDAMGRVTERTTTSDTPDGTVAVDESFESDGLGRVVEHGVTSTGDDSLTTSVSFDYNAADESPQVIETTTLGTMAPREVTTTFFHTGQPNTKTLEGGRTLSYDYNGAGLLSDISVGGASLASLKYAGDRMVENVIGGTVEAAYSYNPALYGFRVSGTTHTDVSTSTTLDARTNQWDGNYNRTGRSITGGPESLQASFAFLYDGLNRMERSEKTPDGGAMSHVDYTLDASGNREETNDGSGAETYGMSGTGALLHQYASSPHGDFGYDGAGRVNDLTSAGKSYKYDALGRLKELRLAAGVLVAHMDGPTLPTNYTVDSGTWSVANDYLEETSTGAGRIRWLMDAGLRKFSFKYWTGHDPADPDGDLDTDADHFDPEYYAQVILRAKEYTTGEDAGEWTFLALVIQPDGIYLREWDKDVVTELGGVEVAIEDQAWHDVVIELSGADGEHVVVKQRLNGATETQSIEADTTIIIADGDTADRYVGFGVGEKADFRFDDAGTDKAVAASVALRYHYDAHGRVVGRTLDPDGGTPASQYFVYDNDRIVQELDGNGNLVAEWVYGTYIDEVLAMYRDTDGQPGFETYYYIQDDLYNVVALTDEDGEVVERYTYGDYGAPTVWIEDDQNPGTWIENETTDNIPVSSVGNPHMFTGRRWDEVLALYDYRTRYYNPYLGRFLRKDTIGLWGDPNNLGNPYAYCGNNPWSSVDPWGEVGAGSGYVAENPVLSEINLELAGPENLQKMHRFNSVIKQGSRAGHEFSESITDSVLDEVTCGLAGESAIEQAYGVGDDHLPGLVMTLYIGGTALKSGPGIVKGGREAIEAAWKRKRTWGAWLVRLFTGASDNIFEAALDGRKLADLGNPEVGAIGEALILKHLREAGFDDVVAIQNASGHGVDVAARSKNGLLFLEVKTTKEGFSANDITKGLTTKLSSAQEHMDDFVESRLRAAAHGTGHYKKLDPELRTQAKTYLKEYQADPTTALGGVVGVDLPNEMILIFEWKK